MRNDSRVPVSAPLLFDFRQLTVYRGERRALHGLDLQLRAGEHLAILGPNGCGKSTLIKTLTRELYPVTDTPGYRFHVLGKEWCDVADFRQTLGIVALDQLQLLSHEVTLRNVTVESLVLSGFFGSLGLWPRMRPTPRMRRRALVLLQSLGLTELRQRPVTELSSGEQRRALIARALVHDPVALLLDEPTTSLDPGATAEFRAVLSRLAREGRSIVLITHDVGDLVPEIGRIAFMRDGRIVADGPPRALLTSDQISALFSHALKLRRRRGVYSLQSDSPPLHPPSAFLPLEIAPPCPAIPGAGRPRGRPDAA